MKNNIDKICFLLKSYNQMLESFGKTENTDDFFIKQLKGLAKTEQINKDEAQIVLKVIGLKKDNNILDWDMRINNINDYMNIINELERYSEDQSKKNKLIRMHKNIAENIFKAIVKTYGFDSYDLNLDECIINSEKNELQKWKKFLNKYGSNYSYSLRTYNISSIDEIQVNFDEFLELFTKESNKYWAINRLKSLAESDFDDLWVIRHNYYDGCHYADKKNSDLTEKAKKFNYKQILKEYNDLFKKKQNKINKNKDYDDYDRD